ncbi:Hypothetical_protein [Hexamita inflata]|uniref:Hypothetical_protein n=1 Tax=Hexamita inflata TaxID=28002 RepID=A0ABP1L0Y3_9EUKA
MPTQQRPSRTLTELLADQFHLIRQLTFKKLVLASQFLFARYFLRLAREDFGTRNRQTFSQEQTRRPFTFTPLLFSFSTNFRQRRFGSFYIQELYFYLIECCLCIVIVSENSL